MGGGGGTYRVTFLALDALPRPPLLLPAGSARCFFFCGRKGATHEGAGVQASKNHCWHQSWSLAVDLPRRAHRSRFRNCDTEAPAALPLDETTVLALMYARYEVMVISPPVHVQSSGRCPSSQHHTSGRVPEQPAPTLRRHARPAASTFHSMRRSYQAISSHDLPAVGAPG
jgi:hypothetical protein